MGSNGLRGRPVSAYSRCSRESRPNYDVSKRVPSLLGERTASLIPSSLNSGEHESRPQSQSRSELVRATPFALRIGTVRVTADGVTRSQGIHAPEAESASPRTSTTPGMALARGVLDIRLDHQHQETWWQSIGPDRLHHPVKCPASRCTSCGFHQLYISYSLDTMRIIYFALVASDIARTPMHDMHGDIRWIRHRQGGAPFIQLSSMHHAQTGLPRDSLTDSASVRVGQRALGIWVRKALMNNGLSTHDYYSAPIRLEQFRRWSISGVGLPVARSEIFSARE